MEIYVEHMYIIEHNDITNTSKPITQPQTRSPGFSSYVCARPHSILLPYPTGHHHPDIYA